MRLKITPHIDARYWVAILLASMLGTNLGDFFPDVLHLSTGLGLVILAVVFFAIVAGERLSAGNEAFYWAILLTVRAAATQIADATVDHGKFGYLPVSLVTAAVLAGLIVIHLRRAKGSLGVDLPPTGGVYWLTMLTAGTLGTLMGDGLGHAIATPEIGWPVSAVLATVALGIVLGLRYASPWKGIVTYWLAIVVVRWWGTNVGDIFNFVTDIWISMAITAVALAAVLMIWRDAKTVRAGDTGSV